MANDPEKGDQDEGGLKRSEHARLRFAQGRPIAQVVNDVQKATKQDVYVQVDDSRFVVRGSKGREHVIEADGEHVTSVRRSDAAHQARLVDGTIRIATEEEFGKLKELVK